MLTELGGDWNGASDNKRPATDEAGAVGCVFVEAVLPSMQFNIATCITRVVVRLGSFVADQATTVEVAITVKGIKGEVCKSN